MEHILLSGTYCIKQAKSSQMWMQGVELSYQLFFFPIEDQIDFFCQNKNFLNPLLFLIWLEKK